VTIDSRQVWLETRRRLEERLARDLLRTTPDGLRPLPLLHGHEGKVKWGIDLAQLGRAGRRNAGSPHVHRISLSPAGLPVGFDGFTILFISDLHLDLPTGALEQAIRLLAEVECDIAVFGGDYQSYGTPPAKDTAAAMAPLVGAIHAKSGVFAILGNHDRHDLVAPLEALGLTLLINESAALARDGETITLIGCDDINVFHDHAAEQALHRGDGFRIALIHSPDFARQAEAAGCAVYLAGHTHGGQICLPGGKPIMTALDHERGLARGVWHKGRMVGYTSTGLGCGGVAARFNCPPEVALITLTRPAP